MNNPKHSFCVCPDGTVFKISSGCLQAYQKGEFSCSIETLGKPNIPYKEMR